MYTKRYLLLLLHTLSQEDPKSHLQARASYRAIHRSRKPHGHQPLTYLICVLIHGQGCFEQPQQAPLGQRQAHWDVLRTLLKAISTINLTANLRLVRLTISQLAWQ